MSFLTDMSINDLEEKFAGVVTLLIVKGIFTIEEYDVIVAEMKRLRDQSDAKKKKELDGLFEDKKGSNA